MIRTSALTLLIGLAAFIAPLGAHHSFVAVYDQTKPVRVEGTIVRLDWRNPHVMFDITSVDASGASTTWSFEMGAPTVLTRRLGWTVDTLKSGDHITVEGFLARTGDRQGAAQFVTTASGQRLRSVLPFR